MVAQANKPTPSHERFDDEGRKERVIHPTKETLREESDEFQGCQPSPMDFETEGYNVEQDGRQPEGEAVRQLSFQQNQQVGELQRQANDKEVAKAFAKQATSMP